MAVIALRSGASFSCQLRQLCNLPTADPSWPQAQAQRPGIFPDKIYEIKLAFKRTPNTAPTTTQTPIQLKERASYTLYQLGSSLRARKAPTAVLRGGVTPRRRQPARRAEAHLGSCRRLLLELVGHHGVARRLERDGLAAAPASILPGKHALTR